MTASNYKTPVAPQETREGEVEFTSNCSLGTLSVPSLHLQFQKGQVVIVDKRSSDEWLLKTISANHLVKASDLRDSVPLNLTIASRLNIRNCVGSRKMLCGMITALQSSPLHLHIGSSLLRFMHAYRQDRSFLQEHSSASITLRESS